MLALFLIYLLYLLLLLQRKFYAIFQFHLSFKLNQQNFTQMTSENCRSHLRQNPLQSVEVKYKNGAFFAANEKKNEQRGIIKS